MIFYVQWIQWTIIVILVEFFSSPLIGSSNMPPEVLLPVLATDVFTKLTAQVPLVAGLFSKLNGEKMFGFTINSMQNLKIQSNKILLFLVGS
jgi:hypothetical protein